MANRVLLAFNSTYAFPETIAAADNVDMQSSGKVINLAAATTAGDAISYAQSGVSLAGLTLSAALAMGGFLINNVGTPVVATDAATKGYVDGLIQGVAWKSPVIATSATNVASLSGATTIDSVSVVAGNRVLLTGQSTATQNGIWVVQSGAWTRPTDFAAGADAANDAVWVEQGGTYADTGWVCTTDTGSAVIGTNNLTIIRFTSATGYTAGAGLTLTGATFSVKGGDGIEVVSNTASTNVRLDTTPGLQFTGSAGSGALQVKVLSTGGIEVLSGGLDIKIDTTTVTGGTVATGSNGLTVTGLPSLFKINNVATSSNVTAANTNTLTGGTASNADALHVHTSTRGSFTTVGALTKADPVFWSTTNDQVDKALANNDAKSFAVGVAMANASGAAVADILFNGIAAGVLSGATAGNVYYLAAAGGITTTVPGSGGNNIVQVGFAKNATDLYVQIQRFGKKV